MSSHREKPAREFKKKEWSNGTTKCIMSVRKRAKDDQISEKRRMIVEKTDFKKSIGTTGSNKLGCIGFVPALLSTVGGNSATNVGYAINSTGVDGGASTNANESTNTFQAPPGFVSKFMEYDAASERDAKLHAALVAVVEEMKKAKVMCNQEELYYAMRYISEALSDPRYSPIEDLVHLNAIEIAVGVLENAEHVGTQSYACLILCNIASDDSSQSLEVIKRGAIPALVKAFCSDNGSLHINSLWALSNIFSNKNAELDNIIKKLRLVNLVSNMAMNSRALELYYAKNMAWLLRNLCDKRSGNSYLLPLFPAILHYIHHENLEVQLEICYALFNFSESATDSDDITSEINAIVNNDMLMQRIAYFLECCLGDRDIMESKSPIALRGTGLVETKTTVTADANANGTESFIDPFAIYKNSLDVKHTTVDEDKNKEVLNQKKKIFSLILKVISNISSGDEKQMEKLIQHGIIIRLIALTKHRRTLDNKYINQIYFILSNVAASVSAHIQYLLDNGVCESAREIVQSSYAAASKEAFILLANIARYGNEEQVTSFMKEQANIETLCKYGLYTQNHETLQNALTAILKILNIGDKLAKRHRGENNEYAHAIESLGVIGEIVKINNDERNGISFTAGKILEFYDFEDDENDENENLEDTMEEFSNPSDSDDE